LRKYASEYKPSKVEDVDREENDDEHGQDVLAVRVARHAQWEYYEYTEQCEYKKDLGGIGDERAHVQARPLNINVLACLSGENQSQDYDDDLEKGPGL
jgi:hypothetical protein